MFQKKQLLLVSALLSQQSTLRIDISQQFTGGDDSPWESVLAGN